MSQALTAIEQGRYQVDTIQRAIDHQTHDNDQRHMARCFALGYMAGFLTPEQLEETARAVRGFNEQERADERDRQRERTERALREWSRADDR